MEEALFDRVLVPLALQARQQRSFEKGCSKQGTVKNLVQAYLVRHLFKSDPTLIPCSFYPHNKRGPKGATDESRATLHHCSGVPDLRASITRENGLKSGKLGLAGNLQHPGFARLFPLYELCTLQAGIHIFCSKRELRSYPGRT